MSDLVASVAFSLESSASLIRVASAAPVSSFPIIPFNSSHIIRELIGIFSRHGIPEVIRSDNGPQYASLEFIKFTREYEIRNITSSLRYPQSNGEAERMVRTVKAMHKKNKNINLGLLAYRNAPLLNGRSPAELLMDRVLRNRISRLDSTLIINKK